MWGAGAKEWPFRCVNQGGGSKQRGPGLALAACVQKSKSQEPSRFATLSTYFREGRESDRNSPTTPSAPRRSSGISGGRECPSATTATQQRDPGVAVGAVWADRTGFRPVRLGSEWVGRGGGTGGRGGAAGGGRGDWGDSGDGRERTDLRAGTRFAPRALDYRPTAPVLVDEGGADLRAGRSNRRCRIYFGQSRRFNLMPSTISFFVMLFAMPDT